MEHRYFYTPNIVPDDREIIEQKTESILKEGYVEETECECGLLDIHVETDPLFFENEAGIRCKCGKKEFTLSKTRISNS